MRTEDVAIPWTGKPHEGVTMSTLLRTAYALVVGKYTASRDVVFGTTLSGRNAPIADGAASLWTHMSGLLNELVQAGHLPT